MVTTTAVVSRCAVVISHPQVLMLRTLTDADSDCTATELAAALREPRVMPVVRTASALQARHLAHRRRRDRDGATEWAWMLTAAGREIGSEMTAAGIDDGPAAVFLDPTGHAPSQIMRLHGPRVEQTISIRI